MKLAHLSDLHLGKRVNGFSLLEDQRHMLREILEILAEEQPDAVVLAGDLYDKPVPPAEAVELLDAFLVELAAQQHPVLAVSGNHDSPERIAFAARLLEKSGVYVSGGYDGEVRPVTLQDAWENLKGACISLAIGAAVYLVIVRKLLMRNGVYLDRWPAWLDLENCVYRPALAGLSFLGALAARAAASLGDVVIYLGERLLFTNAPGVFIPKQAENFGEYGKKPRRFLVGETFAFDLLTAGVGIIVLLLYILM